MQVETFVGKVSVDALRQMDQHINQWLRTRGVQPVFVTQTFGYETSREFGNSEPVLITSLWY